MDWITIGLFVFLIIIVTLIAFTLYHLLPLGDERKKKIQLKASAYSFSVVIIYLLIEIGYMFYKNLGTIEAYEKLNPFIVLIVFSIIYLLSLVRSNRKYS